MTSTTGPRAHAAVRPTWGTTTVLSWLAALAAVLVVAAPFALAAAAPRFAVLPVAVAAASVPPLPEPGPDATATLNGLIDPVPLVVADLPDEASRLAAADWAAASLREPADVAAMLDHAWQGLVVDPAEGDALLDYANYLLFGGGYVVPEQAVLGEPSDEAMAAMATVTGDPRNADRLSNLAVALFALGTTNEHGPPLTTLYEAELASPAILQHHAVELLAAVDRAFPPTRAVRLNLAFFVSVIPSPTGGVPSAIPVAERALAANPDDRTARLLLGSLQARRIDARDGVDRAVAILRPLLAEPATAALGHAALGDAYLAAATVRPEAPFSGRDLARQAIAHYDRAIAALAEPGLYAGRAAALAVIGETPDALVAQQRAIDLAPDSVALRLGLARLREATGDFAGMREAATEALGLVEASWNPRLAAVRFVAAPSSPTVGFVVPGDLGYLGYSVGSERDHLGLSRSWEGGAFVVSLDLIPRTNAPYLDAWRVTGFAPDVAAELATAATILAGGAGTAGERPDPPVLLAAGKPLPPDADPAMTLRTVETVLRQAGQFDAAARLCQRIRSAPDATQFDHAAVLQCIGEAAYLAGNPELGAAGLGAAYTAAGNRARTGSGPLPTPLPTLRLRAAAAAEAADRRDRARDLYTLAIADVSSDPQTVAQAAAKLGELAQDDGDAVAAIGWYDLALALVTASGDPSWSGSTETILLARTVTKRAHGNRGVARLASAQPGQTAAPDCTGPGRQRCEAAADDFAAALAVDPLDPVVLLDQAWAARLLGDDGSARAALALAVAVDPTLFPAHNDLGVLQARAGDDRAARHSFAAALATAPDYDLAAWNLGILELRRGVAGVLPGEAWVQRAISANRALAGDDLALKTDERVYRVESGIGAGVGQGWSFGRASSLSAVVLGGVTVAATLGGSLHALLLGTSSSIVTEHGPARLNRAGTFLRAGLRRRLPRPRWRWWLAWEPWLVTIPALALVTAWPAWRANPSIGPAAVAMALLAAAVALAAHELGHALAARVAGARLAPAQWGPGVGLALLLLPLRLSSGPFVAQRVLGVDAGRAWWVYLAGPAANLAVAVATYLVYLERPAPVLRLVVAAQLAAIGYAMLPFPPMDGSVLKRRPVVMVAVGLAIAVAGLVLAGV